MTRLAGAVVLVLYATVAATAFAESPAMTGLTLREAMDLGKGDIVDDGLIARRLRLDLVRDAAQTVGVYGGYTERARELSALLERRSEQLDSIFAFQPFVSGGRVLAPVVEVVDEVQAIEPGGVAMRETARVLRVIAPARLVTVEPTWRDWVTVHVDSLAPPQVDPATFPVDADERGVWRGEIAGAWQTGRRQADAVFEAQMAQLRRDYEGMLRYTNLLAQGIIAPASVGATQLGIVRKPGELRIGDALYTVDSPAEFQDADKWRAIATPSVAPDSADRPGARQ